ncbi:MAG: hypothetical protein ACW964_03360 [Candidatus Hodarchaeales archaeon]|jgi:uncharacterized membrane protein
MILLSLILWPISSSITKPNQEISISCFIFFDSECPVCYQKYLEYGKPLYDKYQSNNNTEFQIVDIENDYVFFWGEVRRLNIDYESLGLDNLPWVVFLWGDSKEVGLDYYNLEFVEPVYLAILDDPNFNPNPPEYQLKVVIEQIDPFILFISGLIIVIELFILTVSIRFYNRKMKSESWLRRISMNRVLIVTVLSFISILTLTYQLLDYIRGGCGCATSSLIKSLEFRRYEFFNLFGIRIPFSLIGLVLMNAILVQTIFIGVVKTPSVIKLFKTRRIVISERVLNYIHKFLVLQAVSAFLSLFYLLYIELFIVHFICLLCTISQVIIVINTILIVSWRPRLRKPNSINFKNY